MAKKLPETASTDFYEGVPIVDTWREGRDVEDGWRGVMGDGREVFMRERDPDRVARIPERDKLVITDGLTVTGIVKLERAGL
jgi:hypothetical protein